MEAKLALKTENAIAPLTAIKNDLLIFNKGFYHFESIYISEDGGHIRYTLINSKHAAEARAIAEKRINEMGLRLLAVGTGILSNTFIVRIQEAKNV
jgi:hypothetical protein